MSLCRDLPREPLCRHPAESCSQQPPPRRSSGCPELELVPLCIFRLSVSVFSYLIVFVLSKSYCLSYNISPLLEMGTSILYLHIQLFHLSLSFLSLPLFLCCQLAKYFMHVQQVPHILNEHPYDDVAVSTFLDLDAASPGTTANLYISVQS